MADDPDRDLIPSRDIVKGPFPPHTTTYTESTDLHGLDKLSVFDKKAAEQLSRNDLEDQLYRLKEENMHLKKNSRKQEDQLKKLATKTSRLLNEKKKGDSTCSPTRRRDIEIEEAMEDLHDKVRSLEKNNIQLREKLLVARQQVFSQTRRPNAYSYVPPKVNSNRPRSGVTQYTVPSNPRIPVNNSRGQLASGPLPAYVTQLLEEARNELFHLQEVVSTQRNELDMYEQEVEILKDSVRIKDAEFAEETNVLKSQITEGQRQHLQENLNLIHLHRELKQKNTKIISLQSQLKDHEEKLRAHRSTHDRLLKEVEDHSTHYQEEQKKSLELLAELQKSKNGLHSVAELQDNLKVLKKENDALKDTNDKLIKSVLNQDQDRTSQSAEQVLKERIANLETSLNNEIREKTTIQDNLRNERDKYQHLNNEYIELQNNFASLKKQAEELELKVNLLKDEEVDFEELGEALALIKLKKQSSINIDFLQSIGNQVEKEDQNDLRLKLSKSEKDHTETIKELCNVREMLMTQYKINKDAQEELKKVSENFLLQEKEYKTKLEEYACLLDIRASKIQKLERQLNDVAYGTKKYKIEEIQSEIDKIQSLDLGRGENLFEIHVTKFVYSENGLKILKNRNPSSFMTWNFYEFELQSTKVVKGANPHFDCSRQYKVKTDDFFLCYLHKNPMTLELHESIGTEFQTLAACQIGFSELLEQPSGRLHGTQHLIGIYNGAKGIVFGTVDFWVKLHLPVEDTFKLFKQKMKALKYIHSNQVTTSVAANLLNKPSQKDSSVNELHIKIIRCNSLKVTNKDIQPSSFCMYKLYNFQDQDTTIIPASNNPEFSHHETVLIPIDSDFEKYLRTQNLAIYVIDDSNPDLESYIGKASIPLLPLSQEKSVAGTFELKKNGVKENCGTIEVSIFWKSSYQSPPSSATLPSQLEMPIEFPQHISPIVPVFTEDDASKTTKDVIPTFPPKKPARKSRKTPIINPIRTSTPIEQISEISSSSCNDEDETKPMSVVPINVTELINSPAQHLEVPSKSAPATTDEFDESSIVSHKSNETKILEVNETKTESSANNTPSNKGRKTPNYLKNGDSISEKKQEISFEELTDEDKQAVANSDTSLESDLDDRDSVSSHSAATETHSIPSITVTVHKLTLNPGSSILNNPNIQMLYVEYKFLDYPLEELETPYSLPKPIPPDAIAFNFKKEFIFHPDKNVDKFKLLAEMFNSDMPEGSWIKFTIVSEPPSDDDNLDCAEIGYACIDLRDIIKNRKDMIETDIAMYDAQHSEMEIGKLTVSIEALRVLVFL